MRHAVSTSRQLERLRAADRPPGPQRQPAHIESCMTDLAKRAVHLRFAADRPRSLAGHATGRVPATGASWLGYEIVLMQRKLRKGAEATGQAGMIKASSGSLPRRSERGRDEPGGQSAQGHDGRRQTL